MVRKSPLQAVAVGLNKLAFPRSPRRLIFQTSSAPPLGTIISLKSMSCANLVGCWTTVGLFRFVGHAAQNVRRKPPLFRPSGVAIHFLAGDVAGEGHLIPRDTNTPCSSLSSLGSSTPALPDFCQSACTEPGLHAGAYPLRAPFSSGHCGGAEFPALGRPRATFHQREHCMGSLLRP